MGGVLTVRCQKFCVKLFFFLQGLAYFCTAMLLGGAWLGAAGWRMYTPDGTFITITYPNGVTARELTQCMGPPSLTFWLGKILLDP